MERRSILYVTVVKPNNVSYAEIMNRLRTWLDTAKIQPTNFRSVADGFELSFRNERDARLFAEEFS